MNYIVTSKPAQLPVYQDRPITRPVAVVAGSAGEFRDASKQAPSSYVYRGELLEAQMERMKLLKAEVEWTDYSKLSPIKGFQRIFSIKGLFELVKNLLKLVLIGTVAYSVLIKMWPPRSSKRCASSSAKNCEPWTG